MSRSTSTSAGWTDARVAQLRTLWRDGQSATTVAHALGVSRNAVIGKVHRLGLSGDGRHAAAQVRPPKRPRSHPGSPQLQPPRPSKERLTAKRAAGVSTEPLAGLVRRLEHLGAQACHWPIGDPRAGDFAFCGRPAEAGCYCGRHDAIAHRRGIRARV